MVFTSPAWVPDLPFDPPDSISLDEFMLGDHGRTPFAHSRHPYTCAVTGKSYTAEQVRTRVVNVSRALSKRLDFAPNTQNEWEKVVAIFSINAIDYIPLNYAVHRLGGIVTPASALYSAQELEHQLRSAGAKALFTCAALFDTALKAATAVGIPIDRIFILSTPDQITNDKVQQCTTFEDLAREGELLPSLEPLNWIKGQGARQIAYLCYSSGTSGLPKAVMISHRNVICNILQYSTFESAAAEKFGFKTQIVLGVLPFSHIYGLIIVTHANTFKGDQVIVLPRFKLKALLEAVQKYKIELLCVVPPIIIQLIRNRELCSEYNLSSVRYLYTGAAPLGSETAAEISKQYPGWRVGQGYGMTETCTVISSTSEIDIDQGSSGSLMPGTKAKIVDTATGEEITTYNKPGELLIQSDSVALGYMNNEKATAETFIFGKDGRWIRTGDEVLFRKSAAGHEHLVVVDRLKELIKVKGHQVAPAELEAHLLTHPYVEDCAVIQVPDAIAGEVPKAFVVRSSASRSVPSEEVTSAVRKHVENHKARHKWLDGGISFIEVVPKSPSGKILRRLLRDKERAARKANVSKL